MPGRESAPVFFGGGTPSLMPPETVAALLDRVRAQWGLTPDVEVTLEANPNSAEAARFRAFAAAGVNRLSLGVQALDPTALRMLGRSPMTETRRSRRSIRCVLALAPARANLAGVAGAAIIALYAAALWNVQRFWHDDVAYYTRLIEIDPEQNNSHYGLGQVFERRGDFAAADREFSVVARRDPQSVVLYDLGVVHARLGRIKQAADEEAQGLKQWPNAPADAYIGLAQLYDQGGDQAASEAALSHAESMPGGAEAAALARAQSKFNHGDLAGADSVLHELANRTPNDSPVWTMMGLVAARLQRNEEALSDYQRALALAPRDTFTRLLSAAVLLRMDRDSEALDQTRAVLAVSPNDPNGRALLDKINRKMAAQAPH